VTALDIEALKLLKAPDAPTEVPTDDDWGLIESAFLEFPEDYKCFLGKYGTGCIAGFIYIFNPASKNDNLNLSKQIEKQLWSLRECRPEGLRLYPEVGGILPFGITDNGDLLGWNINRGDGVSGIIVVDSRTSAWETFNIGFSQFLVGILRKNIVCTIFPDDFPPHQPEFIPI